MPLRLWARIRTLVRELKIPQPWWISQKRKDEESLEASKRRHMLRNLLEASDSTQTRNLAREVSPYRNVTDTVYGLHDGQKQTHWRPQPAPGLPKATGWPSAQRCPQPAWHGGSQGCSLKQALLPILPSGCRKVPALFTWVLLLPYTLSLQKHSHKPREYLPYHKTWKATTVLLKWSPSWQVPTDHAGPRPHPWHS